MHKQLTLEQRYYIYIAGKKRQSMRSIATDLGIAHSTVGRELKRNTGKRGYRHQQANTLAQQRHAVSGLFEHAQPTTRRRYKSITTAK